MIRGQREPKWKSRIRTQLHSTYLGKGISVKSIRILSACLLLSVSSGAMAQSVTGQISGTVEDPGGSVVADASIRLTHDLSKQVRTFVSDSNGNFLFTNLVPSDYSLHIEHPGFKGYDQRAIGVSAEERVSLHETRLTVGDVTSTVEVMAEAARVSTETSDRSILVTQRQIEDTPISGRDYLGILRSLPGVQMVSTADMPGWFNTTGNLVNGGQSGQFLVTLDGVASQDSGFPALRRNPTAYPKGQLLR
jgi:hypothetical protein